MKWIDTVDLETWAKRFDAKGNFPYLISRLIRSTSTKVTSLRCPGGKDVYIGGWDGIVEADDSTEYIPKGVSLWEFGTSDNSKKKADDDYKKRTDNPLGYDSAKSTFVFATPRIWEGKEDWKKEKEAEKIWQAIKVYDARDIEGWIEKDSAVGIWFGIELGKPIDDGILSTEHYWDEWSITPKGLHIPPSLVTSGREFEIEQLKDFFNNVAGVKAVRAASKDEAIAFVVACAKGFDVQNKETFFSKSLVLENVNIFRRIALGRHPLILIPKFDGTQPMYHAASKGHHVILPLGADDTPNPEITTLTLPKIDREKMVESLMEIKFSKDEAKAFVRESAGNVTVLKRLLGVSQDKIEWAKADNARELIPALLVGRWDEDREGDKEILAKLSGEKYETYINKLSKWKSISDSPIYQIGSKWRLVSPLDAWANLSRYLTNDDLKRLKECFLQATSEINPSFDLEPEERFKASLYNKISKYSGWVREGLTQSLILISVHGSGLKLPIASTPQLWVDAIVSDLLKSAKGKLWASLNSIMPLLAEASPDSFLNSIEASLSEKKPEVLEMFEEEPSILFKHSHHTGLLWALESLSWMPDYLARTSLNLATLTRLDPGGGLANRPLNSLTEIFKPWHYQTYASFEERLVVLKLLSKKETDIAWKLLMRMLPMLGGEVAQPTHKMRWRLFNYSFVYTYQEIWDTHSAVIDLLLSIYDFSESKLSNLIDISTNNLQQKDREKILSFIESTLDKVTETDYSAWHEVRQFLSKHRSHPDAKWTMPKMILDRYENLYEKLQPKDVVKKNMWMFEENWPSFPEGIVHTKGSYADEQKIVFEKRVAGLRNIYSQLGIEKIIDLSFSAKEGWSMGYALAEITDEEKEIFSVCELLNKEGVNEKFVYGFIANKTRQNGIEWIFTLFKKLESKKFNNAPLAQLLIPIDQTKLLWDFIDTIDKGIKQEYWLKMYPHFFHVSQEEKILGLNRLLEFKRYFSALDISAHFSNKLPTELLVQILEKAATEKSNEAEKLDWYDVTRLFEELDKRSDAQKESLIRLEWLYLHILASYSSNRKPKFLHDEISNNPIFFVEVLKWVYKPTDADITEAETTDLTDEQKANRARQAFELLHSWKKIPGVNDSGEIDHTFLTNWVKNARELAKKQGRLKAADSQIGQVLAQYPEKKNDTNWPPDEICTIIEEINTKSIKSNFSAATFNKRGSSSKALYEGGERERALAKYFRELSSNKKNKFPSVASILESLAKGYEAEAKQEDERAERDKLEY